MKKTLPIIVITGATASGKTEAAIQIAKKINAQIICADSRIIYKDLTIVSAKPSIEERGGIIHHLIDIKSPDEGIYSAGDFAADAKKIIENADCPIIIQGGTWFYIKSLLDEKSLIGYGQDKDFRKSLQDYSNEELWNILNKKDASRALSIHKNNRDKIIRSLELINSIGGKLSEYEREKNNCYRADWYIMETERQKLYEKINLRTDLMIKNGLWEEWRQNKEKYGRIDLLYNTIGYKEFFELEDGIWTDFKTAVDKIKQRTRNFAKRQLTWFRQNKDIFSMRTIEEFKIENYLS